MVQIVWVKITFYCEELYILVCRVLVLYQIVPTCAHPYSHTLSMVQWKKVA